MSHPPIKKKMSQGKPLLLPLALVILVVWLGWRFWLAYQPEPVHLQGQIEAQQYSVSSKVPGRIDEVLVKKGDQLTKDQLVFTLASPEIEAKLSQAKAGEAAAGALAQEAEKGARAQQIAAAKDQWQKAKAAAQLRGKTYERVASLHRDGVMPLQKRDEAWTAWQAARWRWKGRGKRPRSPLARRPRWRRVLLPRLRPIWPIPVSSAPTQAR